MGKTRILLAAIGKFSPPSPQKGGLRQELANSHAEWDETRI